MMDEKESRPFPIDASSKSRNVPPDTRTDGVVPGGRGGAAVGPGVREDDGARDGDEAEAEAKAVCSGVLEGSPSRSRSSGTR